MSGSRRSRALGPAWGSLLVASFSLACGGESTSHSNDAHAHGGSAATSGTGGTTATGGSGGSGGKICPGIALAPEITLTPHCDNFVPSLSTATLNWVGIEAVDGEPPLVSHLFEAPESLANGCGFDVALGLPHVTFAGTGTYNLNAWWTYENGVPRLMAAVLRREGEELPDLGVGEVDAGQLASMLSAPLAIEPSGPMCDRCMSAEEGLRQPALSENDVELSCEPEGFSTLLRCHGSDIDWSVVAYCTSEGSAEYPVVYGRAEMLTP